MKLLICTQAIDVTDPVLGFFVRWVEEFAKHCEEVTVICLKEGKHDLPANVRVHSLGKERTQPTADSRQPTARHGRVPEWLEAISYKLSARILYTARFYRLIWSLRHEYDAVFVHMNPEYVVLGGAFWCLWGKRVNLWYAHKSVTFKLRVAVRFAYRVLTPSTESFRLVTRKLCILGHGIDTDFFTPDASVTRTEYLVSAGRLAPSKRHDLAIHAAVRAGRELHILGEGPARSELERCARETGAQVRFLGPGSQEGMRSAYRTAHAMVHTSETGSMDKVVLEALACGCPVITTSGAYPDAPVAHADATPIAIAACVNDDAYTGEMRAAYVMDHHSLSRLIPRIMDTYVRTAGTP
jgi:glycosyltransferase involved in cell wall biosynthesis